jgi:flagellar secretion chaperone FliS
LYTATALARTQSYRALELASRLEGASPHKLVSILYEELQRSLAVMEAAIGQGKTLSQERHSQRARSILVALIASLDFERGGSVASTLNGVYKVMMVRLDSAIHYNDVSKLADLREGVEYIATSWNKLAPSAHRAS